MAERGEDIGAGGLGAGVLDTELSRLRDNIAFLLEKNGWTKTQLKGYAMARGVSGRTVDSMIAGEGNFELRSLALVAEVLGVDTGRILLPLDELKAHVLDEGLRPLASPRPATNSSPSSEASGAGGSRKLGDTLALLARAS